MISINERLTLVQSIRNLGDKNFQKQPAKNVIQVNTYLKGKTGVISSFLGHYNSVIEAGRNQLIFTLRASSQIDWIYPVWEDYLHPLI
jgi:hypothetical protein